MNKIIKPPIWLLALIIWLTQLTETVYSPALPKIASALHVAESWVEYTLTIFLLGFAMGTLFWGIVSDKCGRKPCLLLGMCIYILGSILCYYSSNIECLLISRFIQAFGGSVGSVLGQAICRDAFADKERGRVFSIIGSTLAFSPAIGPVIGGMIDQHFGWNAIFIALIALGTLILILSSILLVETHPKSSRIDNSTIDLAQKLFKNHKVIAYGIIISICNGITFSYYAEGSFYLINMLELSPSEYGISFLPIALAGAFGGWISKKLNKNYLPLEIIKKGIIITLIGCTFFMLNTLLFDFINATKQSSVILTILSIMMIMIGIWIIIPNTISIALEDFKYAIGIASSIFGFFYYILISLITFGIGLLHNGTLIIMPIYIFCLNLIMIMAFFYIIITNKSTS